MSLFLVIGGAGRTGARVTDRLLAGGHQVRVASRRPRPASSPAVHVAHIVLSSARTGADKLFEGVSGATTSPSGGWP